MNTTTQLYLSGFMMKQADLAGTLTGGETGFEKAMGGLSFVPGVGFLGNFGQGASQLLRGHPWKALGSAALGAGSLFTGGAANDVVKGVGAAGRLAKATPTFARGFDALKSVPKSIMGLHPMIPGIAKNFPSSWVSGGLNTGKGLTGTAKNIVGSTAVGTVTNKLDAAPGMAKDRAFDSTASLASGASNIGSMLGGGNQDPRYLKPMEMPAPFSPMFHS